MIGQQYNGGTDDRFSFRVERRELAELLGHLNVGQSVLVSGGRKLGKTVLLQQVKAHFETQQSNSALSHKVPLAVDSFLGRRGVKTKCQPAPDRWHNDPSAEFIRYLNNVLDHLDNTVGRVVLIYLLDECEALLGAEETHTLLGNLRALVGPETDNRVKLVVTGFRDIKEYEDPVTGTSPFKNVLLPMPLTLFQENEFDELVAPLLGSLPTENQLNLREQVWRATGGHPCIAQIICRLLTTEFSPESFIAASDKATKLLHAMAFDSWVSRFKPNDHQLFRRVLEGKGAPGESPISVEFLQYCGVITVNGDNLVAPCGLFNEWYKRQAAPVHEHHASTGQAGPRGATEGRLSDAPSEVSGLSRAALAASHPAKPSYALVMKGGGVKGLAYIGALKELEKYYRFHWFVGTSAGAIAAVLLAVGYSTNELEKILSEKNFREFLDSSLTGLPINLISKGGLYEARSFTTWLDELIAARIESFEPVQLEELPKRVTVYASRRNRSALIFDKQGPNSDKAASFAVRCSMSIPLIFTPQRDQGMRVLDGGMQNNYPVSELLKKNPETEFIGLYLGHRYEGTPKEPSLLSDMLSIWTESVDVEALRIYKEKTVVIDPRPITTIDFNLSAQEKERAAALRFLFKNGVSNGPTESEVKQAEDKAKKLRAEVQIIRSQRRRKRWIKLSLLLLLIIAASIGFYFYFY